MPKTPTSKHFIREWRKHRDLTLEQLAERIGMSHQNLGKIERGLVPYNQVLLEALAEELRCAPADLIIRGPEDPESLQSVVSGMRPAQVVQLVEIAKTIKRTGTDG